MMPMQDSTFRLLVASVATLAVLAGGAVAFASAPLQASAPAPSSPSLTLEVHPAVGMTPASYSPAQPMIRHGAATITIINRDMSDHSFNVPGLGLSIFVPAGATVTTSLNLHQTGSFAWYCWSPCPGMDGGNGMMHGANGMTGDLVVV